MNIRAKSILSPVIKGVIFLLVVWYVYRLLTANTALGDFRNLLSSISVPTIYFSLGIVFALMFANWITEAFKWQFICLQFQPITIKKAIESVFCGLAWAVFTPNRIGEYGGRVLFLSPKKRVFGVIGMGIGSISLMVITNVVGIISLCWFSYAHLGITGFWFFGVCMLTIAYALFFIILYFRIRLLNDILMRIKFLVKYERFFSLLLRYDQRNLRKIILYSALRYAVFTSQYCLLMQVFIPELPFIEMLMMIFLLFFVQSALPSLDLFDVGVRSITASYFFGFITDQQVAVMAIAACIWLVNLIIPAIIGSFFTFKINFFGTSTD